MTSRLSAEDLEARLRDIDYRIAMDQQCPAMEVSAHRTMADAVSATNPITSSMDAPSAFFYRASYRIKTLLGPGKFSNPASEPVVVVVKLNEHGNYPFTRPESIVTGPTIPWSPHFYRGLNICFERPGTVWAADGKKTLGHLLIHLARLVNFDEMIADPAYGGYNQPAVHYWRTAMKSGPVDAKVAYPVLPRWLFALPGNQSRVKAAIAPRRAGATVIGRPSSG